MMKPSHLLACLLLAGATLTAPAARAENRMGYQLLTPDAAAQLPHNHGSLGLQIARMQQITDGGMTFDIIRVTQVARNSAGARSGIVAGDQIIAVDGHVFASLASFAAYVGSVRPGTQISVDYMPANGGPAQAQRLSITVAEAGAPAPPPTEMSTREKVAIGVGAAALLGCYEMGCFSHNQTRPPAGPTPQQPVPQR